MTKAELIYNTIHSNSQSSREILNDSSYFQKFLSEKYDDEVLQVEMHLLEKEKEESHLFSDENLFLPAWTVIHICAPNNFYNELCLSFYLYCHVAGRQITFKK